MDDRPTFPLANLLTLPDGSRAEWEAVGAGRPLLWIEGGPGLPAHLARPDLALLADRFRGHLVNAPGSGRSSAPAGVDAYSLDATVRFFDAVRAALGLGRVTLMGHSWGGLVALAFALARPDVIDAVIVLDGYAGEASVPEEAAEAGRERALDWPLYFVEPTTHPAAGHIRRLARETRWNIDAVRAWEPEPPIDLRAGLASLRCPVLVLVGEHDFIAGRYGRAPSPTRHPWRRSTSSEASGTCRSTRRRRSSARSSWTGSAALQGAGASPGPAASRRRQPR